MIPTAALATGCRPVGRGSFRYSVMKCELNLVTETSAADAALSGRLDTLEADPTTATAVAAVQSDVDQNEADADAAIALKLDTLLALLLPVL